MRSRFICFFASTFFASTFIASRALAQETAPPLPSVAISQPPAPPAAPTNPTEHLHDGLYFRLGLGPSFVATHGTDDQNATTDRGVGLALWLGIGGTRMPGLVVGALLHAEEADDGAHAVSIGDDDHRGRALPARSSRRFKVGDDPSSMRHSSRSNRNCAGS